MTDDIESDSERTYEWWLNAYGDMTYTDNTVLVDNDGGKLYANVAYPDVTSSYFDGFVDADGNPLVNESGEVIPIPEGANAYNDKRVCFKTNPVKATKMVTLMQTFEDDKKDTTIENYGNYIKIVTDEITVYVNLTDGIEIAADGYTFDGSALVIGENSVMLTDGKILKKNNTVLVSADNNVSVAYGNGEVSISSLNGKSTVYINEDIISAYLVRNENIYPMNRIEKFGVTYSDKTFYLYPGEYHIYVNGKLPEGHYSVMENVVGEGIVESDCGETVLYRGVVEYKITPSEGWYIKDIEYNGEKVEINSSGIFKTSPVEKDISLNVEFAEITGAEQVSVQTFEKVFEENGDTTVTVGEIINKGLPVSEFGILAGNTNSDFKIADADGKNIRKIPAVKTGAGGYFGVMIKDSRKLLGNDYHTRAYAVINGKEYYGDVVCALSNGGYDLGKDTKLSKVMISGEEIIFAGNVCYLDKCVATSAVCEVTPVNKDALCTVTKSVFKEPGGKIGTVFKINVISADGTQTEDYTVYCFDKSFAPAVADADLRQEQKFPGDYPLVYITKNDISTLLCYDISQVQEFDAAILKLTEYQSTLCENTLSIYETESVLWDENNISYFNAPERGNLITTYTTSSASGYEAVEIDITEYVKKLKKEGKNILNLTITGDNLSMFCTKETTVSTYKPMIIFE